MQGIISQEVDNSGFILENADVKIGPTSLSFFYQMIFGLLGL
jgi:hypothetical protein